MQLTTRTIERLEVPSSNIMSWRTGKLIFEDDDIDQVFSDLGRHFGTTFSVTDSAMLGCEVRANFEGNTQAEVIESIAFVLGWEFETSPEGIVMTGEPCKSEGQ